MTDVRPTPVTDLGTRGLASPDGSDLPNSFGQIKIGWINYQNSPLGRVKGKGGGDACDAGCPLKKTTVLENGFGREDRARILAGAERRDLARHFVVCRRHRFR
jgi:hypothetical protein